MPSSATAPLPQLRPAPTRLALTAVPRRVLAAAGRLLGGLLAMVERATSRRYLAEMDGRMLRDIGLTPPDRDEELRKWFWHR